jgi:hypothetical protein
VCPRYDSDSLAENKRKTADEDKRSWVGGGGKSFCAVVLS